MEWLCRHVTCGMRFGSYYQSLKDTIYRWGEGESDQHSFKAGIVSKGPWGMLPSPNTNRCHSPVLDWPEALTHGSLVRRFSPCAFCHLSLQGRTSKEKTSVSFWLILFCFRPIRATPWLCLEPLILAGPGESPCWMQRVKCIQCIFQGAWWKVLTDVDFSFVIQVLLKNHLMSLG